MSTHWGLILTIGTFDGVHLGHRHLVHQVVSRARERMTPGKKRERCFHLSGPGLALCTLSRAVVPSSVPVGVSTGRPLSQKQVRLRSLSGPSGSVPNCHGCTVCAGGS